VNSPIDLSAHRTLALLNDLKLHVADAAQAEELLNAELRTKRFHADRRHQQGVRQTEERLAAQITEINTHYDTLDAQVKATHENRHTRLIRFQNSGTRNLGRMVQERREKFLGGVQAKQVTLKRSFTQTTNELTEQLNSRIASLQDFGARIGKMEHAARTFLGGYRSFQKLLVKPDDTQPSSDHEKNLEVLETKLTYAKEHLESVRGFLLPRLFATVPPTLAILIIAVIGAVLAFGFGATAGAYQRAGIIAGGLLILLIVFHLMGRTQIKEAAVALARSITSARAVQTKASAHLHETYEAEIKRLTEKHDAEMDSIKNQWGGVDNVQKQFEASAKDKLTNLVPVLIDKNDQLLISKLRFVSSQREEHLRQRQTEAQIATNDFVRAHDSEIAEITAFEAAELAKIEARWKRDVFPIYESMAEVTQSPAASFPDWTRSLLESWSPATQFQPATRFGSIALHLPAETLPRHRSLALPGPADVILPVTLAYPQLGSLLIETNEASGGAVSSTINNIILRLLCTTPPGKVAFTILDPVGLGQNFAGVMHLGDYEETLINRRIWTQRDQIEERLQELNDHIEKVIQMYLRNEYETITQYNEQAGSTAEKYHFLVVADFPNGFSDVAARRLQSIAVSGPRCGVFTLIHWDKRAVNPDGFGPDELRKSSVCIRREQGHFVLDQAPSDSILSLDAAPSDELAVPFLHKIGKASIDSNRVELPFDQIAPQGELWTEDTTQELRVPIGRTGATKLQYLAIGKGTRQHALFAGKTGSGKSTLFHIIITNLALYHSPDQVEFCLIDFKKGVEFKCYATNRLPHAKVVAIESDREFALSVLQRVDEELKRRGDLFR
jgi:Sec-independent protein translocase protein TatA